MNIYRNQFPLLQKTVNGYPLVYFDNAATTPKPLSVIEAISNHYKEHAGNPGRALHTLSQEAEQVISTGREKVLNFLNAPESHTAIFTKSATEAINIIAWSLFFSTRKVKRPTIITTEAEHHSNFLPWLRLHKEFGFDLHIVPVLPTGQINLDMLDNIAKKFPGSLIAITYCSNVTGIITDMSAVSRIAKETSAKLLVDASQSIGHMQIDLSTTPLDYLVASAHKMYGPEGVGMLVVSSNEVKNIESLIVGGGMVEHATTNNYNWLTNEARLEGGTQNTAGIAGTIAAIDFLQHTGWDQIQKQEKDLNNYFQAKINEKSISNCTFYGVNEYARNPIFTFSHTNVHPHDIADFLDQYGIAVRSGYHCAEPLHRALGTTATTRVSLSFLNTTTEIDYLFAVLDKCFKKFA